MTLNCTKCKEKFTNKYHLNRHINRKTPCDVVLQCTRCTKIFDNKRDLDKHTARKFPCKEYIVNTKSIIEIELEIEKEKTIRMNSKIINKIELENVRNMNALNLMNAKKEKETEQKLILLNAEKEKDTEQKIILLNAKKEKDLAKTKQLLEVEAAKLKRKELTVKIANENAAQAKIDNIAKVRQEAMDYIQDYMDEYDVVPYNHFEGYEREFERMMQGFLMIAFEFFTECKTFDEVNERLLKMFLKSEISPKNRKFFYVPTLKEYYSITTKPNTTKKIIRSITYLGEIAPVVKHMLDANYSIFHNYINKMDLNNEKCKAFADHIKTVSVLTTNSKGYSTVNENLVKPSKLY